MKNKKKNKKRKVKKVRIKILNIILAILIIYIVSFGIIKFVNFDITNIYIKNNYYYSDQEIIRLAKIENYPSSLKFTKNKIEENLEKDKLIKTATVTKKYITRVFIDIEENYPILVNN